MTDGRFDVPRELPQRRVGSVLSAKAPERREHRVEPFARTSEAIDESTTRGRGWGRARAESRGVVAPTTSFLQRAQKRDEIGALLIGKTGDVPVQVAVAAARAEAIDERRRAPVVHEGRAEAADTAELQTSLS